MPIDYKKYPPNWKEIRKRILDRAKDCCEFCGVKNYAIGWRDWKDEWNDLPHSHEGDVIADEAEEQGYKIIKIILTIAHLDHDEENHNVKDDRLAALCQRCHLRYDAPEKAKRRSKKKYKNSLFPI